MRRIYHRINRWVERLLIAIFALLVLDVLVQVGSRYLLGQSYSFTEELARFALIWLSILGAAYLTGKNEHLYMDFIFAKLDYKKKITFSKVTQILIALFSLIVLVVGGANLAYITLHLGQMSPALGVPVGYIYMIVPVSGILILFYTCYNFLHLEETVLLNNSENQKE